MKTILTFAFFLVLRTFVFGQELSGTICELKNGKPITLKDSQFFIQGETKSKSFPIDTLGRFKIDMKEIEGLGKTLTFKIGGIGTDYEYADFEIINIPVDSINLILNKIFVKESFMIPSCGSDCFTVNNKRTYREKEFVVDNGLLKYKVKRISKDGKIKQSPTFEIKYQTDFRKDIL